MTKEKAIEILNELFDSYLKTEERCLDTIITVDGKQVTLRDRLDEITDTKIALLTAIDALEQDNGWISVKDRLPDSITPCLITYINRNPVPYYEHIKDKPLTGAGYYFNNMWYWYSESTEDMLNEYGGYWEKGIDNGIEVTHWMLFPEPSKEDDAD